MSYMKSNLRRISLVLAAIMILTAVFSACTDIFGDGFMETTQGAESTTERVDNSTETKDGAGSSVTESTETESSEDTTLTESASEEDETTDATTTEKVEDTTESEPSSSETTEKVDVTETTEATETTKNNETTETTETTKETVKTEETEDTRFEKEYAPVHYMDAKYIAKIAKDYEWGANKSNMLGGYLSADKSYVTLIPFDGEQEACFYLFTDRTAVGPIMVVKYRTVHKSFYMEFFMNSYDSTAQKGCNVNLRGLKTDGEWDIKVVDLNEKLPNAFKGNSLGHLRFDFANGDPIPPECEIDIAYVAFFNTVDDAYKFEYGENYVAPETPEDIVGDKNATLYFDALDIDSAANDYESKNLDSAILSDDLSYITLKPKKSTGPDGYINLLSAQKSAARYFAIKYRTKDLGYWIEVFTDSVNSHATAGSSFTFYPINDGEWHVLVIDIEGKLGDKFNGESLNYIRFDFMNSNDKLGDWSIDIEYIGFYANETDAKGKDYDPNSPVNVFDAEDIKVAIDEKNTGIASATLADDKSYLTVEAAEGVTNAYAYIFTSKREAGRYLLVKYRTESENFYTQLWMNSGAYTAGGAKITMEGFKTDGSWQYGIFDLTTALGEGQYNGQYLSHLRFDFMHQRGDKPAPAGVTFDVAYLAFFDSVEAAEHYAGIYEEPKDPEEGGENTEEIEIVVDEFFGAEEILATSKVNGQKDLASATLSSDKSYVTLKPVVGNSSDAYIKLLTERVDAPKYFAIKYRTTDLGYWIEIFTDSVNEQATGGSSFTFYPIDDGEWHIYIVDLSTKLNAEKYNGESINYIRFDFMNSNEKLGDWSLDVEFIGFFENADDAKGENYDPNAPVNIFDAEDIKAAIDAKNTNVQSATVSSDGEYVSVDIVDGKVEAYSYIFASKRESARYMVVKYRAKSSGFYMTLWMNSTAYTAGGNKAYIEGISATEEWKYVVIDLEQKLGSGYNGEYLAHLRFDFVHTSGDKPATSDMGVDVGYIAFFSSMEAAEAYIAK